MISRKTFMTAEKLDTPLGMDLQSDSEDDEDVFQRMLTFRSNTITEQEMGVSLVNEHDSNFDTSEVLKVNSPGEIEAIRNSWSRIINEGTELPQISQDHFESMKRLSEKSTLEI